MNDTDEDNRNVNPYRVLLLSNELRRHISSIRINWFVIIFKTLIASFSICFLVTHQDESRSLSFFLLFFYAVFHFLQAVFELERLLLLLFGRSLFGANNSLSAYCVTDFITLIFTILVIFNVKGELGFLGGFNKIDTVLIFFLYFEILLIIVPASIIVLIVFYNFINPPVLPAMEYCPEDVKFDQKNCVICVKDFTEREEVTILPCFHIFHGDCLNYWLLFKLCCPVCNRFFLLISLVYRGSSASSDGSGIEENSI